MSFLRRSKGIRQPYLAAVCTSLFLILTCWHALAQDDPLHIWVGKLDRPAAEKWVGAHLTQEQKYVDVLLAVKGLRTIENTLRPFDDAQNELTVAGAEAYLMYAVASQKEVRDAGQSLAQQVQEVATALSLNQDVYRAVSAVDLATADPATRHYMERTLLESVSPGWARMPPPVPKSRRWRTTSPRQPSSSGAMCKSM